MTNEHGVFFFGLALELMDVSNTLILLTAMTWDWRQKRLGLIVYIRSSTSLLIRTQKFDTSVSTQASQAQQIAHIEKLLYLFLQISHSPHTLPNITPHSKPTSECFRPQSAAKDNLVFGSERGGVVEVWTCGGGQGGCGSV